MVGNKGQNPMTAKIMEIFQPHPELDSKGNRRRICTLCNGQSNSPPALLPDYARAMMHAHLALRCSFLLSATDEESKLLLHELRKHCPPSTARQVKGGQQILAAARGVSVEELYPPKEQVPTPKRRASAISRPNDTAGGSRVSESESGTEGRRTRPRRPAGHSRDEERAAWWALQDMTRGRAAVPLAPAPKRTAKGSQGGQGSGRGRGRPAGSQSQMSAPAPRVSAKEIKQHEELVANAVGLHPFIPSADEDALLPPRINQSAYVEVRNHVLARWRSDVRGWMSVEEAGSQIQARHKLLVRLAWRFLNDHGYINFGVVANVVQPQSTALQGIKRQSVVVIGAGFAGLSAARQMLAAGHNVLILEGRNSPGGRTKTVRLEGDKPSQAAVSDLGGSIVTGTDGNPLAVLAAQLDIPCMSILPETALYDAQGQKVDAAMDKKMADYFDKMLERCEESKKEIGPDASYLSLGGALETLWTRAGPGAKGIPGAEELFHWSLGNLEFANACKLGKLSLTQWDQDDPFEVLGEHVFLPGGNKQLVDAMAKGIPILYNSPVASVDYSADGVQISTKDQSFRADAVLVTVPLGVLKKGSIKFSPPLPAKKLDAIERMGFGILNKVVMLFPACFWDKTDMFGRLVGDPSQRGLYYLFYSYDGISGGAQLTALVAGEAAEAHEGRSDEEAVAGVLAVLRQIYGQQGVNVPDPTDAVVTRWGSDPMAFGSYSSLAVGCQGQDYEQLAECVNGRVFFAGEATTHRWPATMHGAFLSGQREAAKISAQLDIRQTGGDAGPIEPTAEALLSQARTLRALFDSPDVEFGSFAAIYGPPGDLQKYALLRTTVPLNGEPNMTWHRPLPADQSAPVYLAIPRSLLSRMRNAKGGDGGRVSLLATGAGYNQLVGRRGLTRLGSSLLEAIRVDRASTAGSSAGR